MDGDRFTSDEGRVAVVLKVRPCSNAVHNVDRFRSHPRSAGPSDLNTVSGREDPRFVNQDAATFGLEERTVVGKELDRVAIRVDAELVATNDRRLQTISQFERVSTSRYSTTGSRISSSGVVAKATESALVASIEESDTTEPPAATGTTSAATTTLVSTVDATTRPTRPKVRETRLFFTTTDGRS